MFAMLNGIVLEKQESKIIIDINGVGYEVNIPISTVIEIGKKIKLYIKTVVREDDISLFGFNSKEEKNIFNMLRSVSGIGAKTALAVLSFYDPNDLNQIMLNKNAKLLSKVPGIGLKTAERIIVDLKEKFHNISKLKYSSSYDTNVYNDLFSALLSLGFKEDKVYNVLKNQDMSGAKSTEEILKDVLKSFA